MKNLILTSTAITMLAGAAASVTPQPAHAENSPYIGLIRTVAYGFCPRGWAKAEGQLLGIAEYPALYALLGTTYGGDRRTTFQLPNFGARSSAHVGRGSGLSDLRMGQRGGTIKFTMKDVNLAPHTHGATSRLHALESPANAAQLEDNYLAGSKIGNTYGNSTNRSQMAQGSVATTLASTGGQQPIQKRSPYLGLTTCIALQGQYPPPK